LPSFVAPTPAQLAPHFPQLEILELLGVGGMGAVYRARQASLDRIVALKILPPEVGRDPSFAERFQREAKHLARLNHPHIVTVYDINRVGEMYYILMEYVDGTNLREVIRTQSLTPAQALVLIPQLCEALQHAHDEGIVHRDIKPENILLDRRGRAKIADFGLAKIVGEQVRDFTLTGTQQVMGTLRYMAPEQMLGARDVDHRADIYALGVILYELLTGNLPMGRFPLPSEKVGVDARMDEVVLKALERERERRYQQAQEIKTDVEEISSTAHVAPVKKQQTAAAVDALRAPLSHEEFEQAAGDVAASSWGLTIVALLQLTFFLAGVAFMAIILAIEPDHREFGLGFAEAISLIIGTPIGAVVLAASIQMRRLRSYEFAVIGSILAMLPTNPLCFLSAPVGLWAFIVLMRPNLRQAFRTPMAQRPENWRANAEPSAYSDEDFEHAAEDVRWASCGLIVICLISLATFVTLAFLELAHVDEFTRHFDAGRGLFIHAGYLEIVFLLTLPLAVLVLPAAIFMRSLRAYELSLIGALLACSPLGVTCVLTMPFGIWALLVLLRPSVRHAFRLPKHKRPEAWRDQDAELLENRARDPAAFARAKERVENRLKAPAMAMIVVSIFDLASAVLLPTVLAQEQLSPTEQLALTQRDSTVTWLILGLLVPAVAALSLQGAWQLLRAKHYRWAMTGVIAFVLPLSVFAVFHLLLGIWIMARLLRRDVRALFAANQRTGRDDDPSVPPAKPIAAQPAYSPDVAEVEYPRLDSQLLFLVLGMVLGALLIAAGVAIVPLAFAYANPRFGAFWGFMGASLGCIGGGLGSLFGSWNDYRQRMGRRNLLLEPGWTWFDEGLGLYAGIGVVLLLAAPVAMVLFENMAATYSLALLGGIVLLQGVAFAGYRALIRAQSNTQDIPRREAWARWWQGTSPFFRRCLQSLCLGTYFLCMALFLTFNSSGSINFSTPDGKVERYDAEVGAPMPWLTLHLDQQGHQVKMMVFTWAWLIAIVGLYAAAVYSYTKGWESPASSRRASLYSSVLTGAWIVLTIGITLLTLSPLIQFRPARDSGGPAVTVDSDGRK
jgi:predicted Ser/Thr protein kinase